MLNIACRWAEITEFGDQFFVETCIETHACPHRYRWARGVSHDEVDLSARRVRVWFYGQQRPAIAA